MVKGLQLAVLLLSAWQSYAWVNGGDYSQKFEKCSGIFSKGLPNDLSTRIYEQQCTDLLIPLDASHQRIGNFSDEQMNYIQSLFRQMFSEVQHTTSNRVKRDAGYGRWRIREEIKANNGLPFKRYAKAVVALKGQGLYDTLADIHVRVISNAHLGPNFLPWHRLYLLVVETALGVPIPYWDSSEDYVKKDPTKSVVWTDKYFGNGYGPVNTGPFAFFGTPIGPLFRKINAWGSLIDRPSIYKYVLSQTRLAQISSPTAKPKSNIEGYHNDVHAWVNGIMGNIPYSAYDPIFFCLHSMLDHIWELFRQRQMSIGINPEFDFVKTNIPGQSPYDKATLQKFTNIDGYSGRIASLVEYAPLSECPVCHGSNDVYCDPFRGICVSRRVFRNEDVIGGLIAADKIAGKSGLSKGVFGAPFNVFRVDKRVRRDPVQ